MPERITELHLFFVIKREIKNYTRYIIGLYHNVLTRQIKTIYPYVFFFYKLFFTLILVRADNKQEICCVKLGDRETENSIWSSLQTRISNVIIYDVLNNFYNSLLNFRAPWNHCANLDKIVANLLYSLVCTFGLYDRLIEDYTYRNAYKTDKNPLTGGSRIL